MTGEIPDGWYHSGNKRAKHIHYFRKGKAVCGWSCHAGIPVDDINGLTGKYTPCYHCQWWYNNLFAPKPSKAKSVQPC